MPRKKTSTEYEKFSTVKVFDTVFANRLSALVKQKKESIGKERLCLDLDVTKRTIELWEARQSRPDIDRLSELADYFDVSVDYLVGRAETPAPTLEDAKIYDEFGLSPRTLGNLEKLKKLQGKLDKSELHENSEIIDYLLSHPWFTWETVRRIYKYTDACIGYNKSLRELNQYEYDAVNNPNKPIDDDVYNAMKKKLKDYEEKRDSMLFHSQKDFLQIVEHMGKQAVGKGESLKWHQ